MLALTRKKDEAIIIDGKIKIKILDVVEGKVRLGIEAPKEMSIHREEIYIDVESSNRGSIEMNQVTLKTLTGLIKDQNK